MSTNRLLYITRDLPPGFHIEALSLPQEAGDDLKGIISRVSVELHQGDTVLAERNVENTRFQARALNAVNELRAQAWEWHSLGPGVPAPWQEWLDYKGDEKLIA